MTPSRDLPDPGIKYTFPILQVDSLLLSHRGSPLGHDEPWENLYICLDLNFPSCQQGIWTR